MMRNDMVRGRPKLPTVTADELIELLDFDGAAVAISDIVRKLEMSYYALTQSDCEVVLETVGLDAPDRLLALCARYAQARVPLLFADVGRDPLGERSDSHREWLARLKGITSPDYQRAEAQARSARSELDRAMRLLSERRRIWEDID